MAEETIFFNNSQNQSSVQILTHCINIQNVQMYMCVYMNIHAKFVIHTEFFFLSVITYRAHAKFKFNQISIVLYGSHN